MKAATGPLRCALLVCAPVVLWFNGTGDNGEWEEEISTDTVLVTPVDSFVTADDTGSCAKKIECRLGDVRMSHVGHNGARIECKTCHHRSNNDDRIKQCAQCHKGVAGLERMHLRCGQCHQARMMGTACDVCHALDPGLAPSRRAPAELLNVKFSHINHHAREEDCNHCHDGLEKKDWLKKKNYPAMTTCTDCHDNRKSSGECSVCHDDVSGIKPRTHNHAWTGRYGHGLDANHNSNECMQCHTRGECDRCHSGQTSYRIHPPEYRFSHGMDVRRGQVNCGMCHDTEQSCSQCHRYRQ